MGSLIYANGKLWTAVGILATHPGRIQERLIKACHEGLVFVPEPVLYQNSALLKSTANQQLRRPWNPRRIQGISRRRTGFRPLGFGGRATGPPGGAHGWLKSAAGRAAGNELRTRKKYVSDRDARFKQPSERCKLLTRWAFEYFDQTLSQ